MVMSNEDKNRSQRHFWITHDFHDPIIDKLLVIFKNLSVIELLELNDEQVNQLLRNNVVMLKRTHQTLAFQTIKEVRDQNSKLYQFDSPLLNKYFV